MLGRMGLSIANERLVQDTIAVEEDSFLHSGQ
jgi:hypothetical protein